MGVNGLVEQVVGFDVPIPLAVAGAAAVVCAEVEHMVSGRARFVAGEFVLGKHAIVVEMGIDAVGQRGIQVEAEPCGGNARSVLVGLCDVGTVAVGVFPTGQRREVFQTTSDVVAGKSDAVARCGLEVDFAFRAVEVGTGLVVAHEFHFAVVFDGFGAASVVEGLGVDVVAEAVAVECQIVLPAVAFVAQREFDVVGTLFVEVFVADFKSVGGNVFAVCVQFLR